MAVRSHGEDSYKAFVHEKGMREERRKDICDMERDRRYTKCHGDRFRDDLSKNKKWLWMHIT